MIISPDNFRVNERGFYDSSPAATELAWDKTFQALVGALVAKPERVLLLVGLPGAGKSTWVERANNSKDVFIDATLTRKIERQPLIECVRHFGDPSVVLKAIVFFTPMIVCMNRNAERPPGRRVPHNILSRMTENMQSDPVTLDEGFDQITAVHYKAP